MNRIDRVSAILIHLQSRRVVRAIEIADRFNISLRTVYRDIKTLEEAGIPIIGEAGVGYSIMEGYKLPPVMFTREEAIALLTAEKFIDNLTDFSTAQNYKSAMYKIKAILRTPEKTLLEELDDSIAVIKSGNNQFGTDAKGHLQILLNGVAKKSVLTIDYFAHSKLGYTQRDIEPIGTFFKEGFWHLLAFCKMRNDYRDFRVDRINRILVTDRIFTGKHPTLQSYLNRTARQNQLDLVVILVKEEIYGHLSNQKYYNGFVSEKFIDGKVEMTFLTSSLEGFARWFMIFGDSAEIFSPKKLKKHVASILIATCKNNFANFSSLLT